MFSFRQPNPSFDSSYPYKTKAMSALNLPKPVNTYAGEDELRNPNGVAGVANGQAVQENGDVEEEWVPPKASDKLKIGIIYPPKDIRSE